MQSWNLREIDTPDGTRSPVVLRSDAAARAVLISLQPGQALILVQPILRAYYAWRAPWTAQVKKRAIQWERVLQKDQRLRRVDAFPRFGLSQPPRGVRVVLYRRK